MNKVTKSFEHYPIGTKCYIFDYNDGDYDIIETEITDAFSHKPNEKPRYGVRDMKSWRGKSNIYISEDKIFFSKEELVDSLILKIEVLIGFRSPEFDPYTGKPIPILLIKPNNVNILRSWFLKLRWIREKLKL